MNRGRKGLKAESFASWLERTTATGESAIPDDSAVMTWADDVGLPHELLNLAWFEFKRRFLPGGTDADVRKSNWRNHFRNFVEKGWLHLWYPKDGGFVLSSQGETVRRLMDQQARRAA